MKTKEEIRIDFYGSEDSRAYDGDELSIMQQYADQQSLEFVRWYLVNQLLGRTMKWDDSELIQQFKQAQK